MLTQWRASTRADRSLFILLCLYLTVLAFVGGASRADEVSQVAAVAASAIVLVVAGARLSVSEWRKARGVAMFLFASVALVMIQLIPLPPALWTVLPGRHVFVEAMAGAGIEPGWHALSLTPDATIFTLLSLAPPIAILAVILRLSGPLRDCLPWLLLILIGGGGMVAMVQIATGSPYFYKIANFGEPTGLFANRNHFALFTALSLPLLAVWASSNRRTAGAAPIKPLVAGGCAILVAAVLLVTGSRGGLLVAGIGYVTAFFIWSKRSNAGSWRQRVLVAGGAVLSFALLCALFIFQSRDVTIGRLLLSGDTDVRSDINSVMLPMIGDYLPFGSGFGSFVSVYKVYEPLATLGPRYVNQAHNDVLQATLEGGLPAAVLLIVFLLWYARNGFLVWRSKETGAVAPSRRRGAPEVGLALPLGQAGSAVILMIGIMSLFDYPMRTPLISVTFVLAMVWLQAGANSRRP